VYANGNNVEYDVQAQLNPLNLRADLPKCFPFLKSLIRFSGTEATIPSNKTSNISARARTVNLIAKYLRCSAPYLVA